MRRVSLALAIGLALIAGAATGQQLYRWTDEKGAVHVTDTPPPASAKNVKKEQAAGGASAPAEPLPFEVSVAAKNFPVKLYTAPNCKEQCDMARAALNKRGVPFKEVQVFDQATNDELKSVVGASEVPALVVGRTVQKGFEQGTYDALLDSAGYPKAGTVPPRSQAAPPPPQPPAGPKAEPVPSEPEAPLGPYAPGAPPQRSQKK